ncbi:hypothetical protein BLA29_000886, partial [Euroglyphus maynei]
MDNHDDQSVSSSLVNINSLSDLMKNTFYLNTDININEIKRLLMNIVPSINKYKFEQFPHVIILRLLHLFGPFENLTEDGEIKCQISSDKLFKHIIVVSSRFHSNLIVHENCEVDDLILLERLAYNANNAVDLTVEYDPMTNESSQTSVSLPSDDDMDSPIANGRIMDIYPNEDSPPTEDNEEVQSVESMILEGELNSDYIIDKDETEKKIETILDGINNDLKEKFSLDRILRTNFYNNLIEDKHIELTLLSQLQYPINSAQQNRFVNIVGIIRRHDNHQLIIYDESIENFEIRIENRGIDYYKSSTSIVPLANNNVNLGKNYPPLKPGNIVCIHQLCLTANNKNICAHSDQIIVIEMNGENDRITTNDNRKICIDEMKRIVELYCHHINELLCFKTRNVKNMDNKSCFSTNLIGLFAAKFPSSDRPVTEIYLLIPTPIKYPASIKENISFITEQIKDSSMNNNNPQHYNESFIRNLKNNNQIIRVSVWENHRQTLDSIVHLDVVILYGVNIRKDNVQDGYYFYTLSNGFIFGRRLVQIKSHTLIDDYLRKLFNTFMKNFSRNIAREQDDNMATQMMTNLDSSILSRLGPDAKQIILKMKDDGIMIPKEQLWKLANIKKNIFCHIKNYRTLFESLVNVDIAKKIDSFSELIQLSSTSDGDDDDDDELQAAANIFRIPARLIDYQFEDKYGFDFYNMAHLRQNQMKIVCTSKSCDFNAPFMSFFLPKTYDYMALSNDSCIDNRTLICQKCGETLAAYLFIEFYLEDDYGNHLTATLSSPEIEELIHCTNKQLICTDPQSTDILNAMNYIFKTLCPI